ncbi:hypothetical protein V8E54_011960 [Elaphomyces granulatus]
MYSAELQPQELFLTTSTLYCLLISKKYSLTIHLAPAKKSSTLSSSLSLPNSSNSEPSRPTTDGGCRGLPFFRAKKSNVTNFKRNEIAWKLTFKGFEVLSWTGDEARRGAANLFVISSIEGGNLANAVSDYGYHPAYRLNLNLEQDAMAALRTVLDGGPLKDHGSVGLVFCEDKSPQEIRCPPIRHRRCFPLSLGRERNEKGQRLEPYPADLLTAGDIVAVETNISSYDIPATGESTGRAGYYLSLRSVLFLGDGKSLRFNPGIKRQEDALISPRKK